MNVQIVALKDKYKPVPLSFTKHLHESTKLSFLYKIFVEITDSDK